MKYYLSEGEAIYMDKNFGLFSKRLAEWAISNMEVMDKATKEIKHVKMRSLDEFVAIAKDAGVEFQDEFLYTAWYLYHMAIADYPQTCPDDKSRVTFAWETINDPDGTPENVLCCFITKMGNANIPIFWEKYL